LVGRGKGPPNPPLQGTLTTFAPLTAGVLYGAHLMTTTIETDWLREEIAAFLGFQHPFVVPTVRVCRQWDVANCRNCGPMTVLSERENTRLGGKR
jgi:hypothetical protein